MSEALFPFVVCVLAVSGCSKSETSGPSANQSEAATPSPGNQIALDACTLLTSAEIEALQGEPLQESKSTAPGDKVAHRLAMFLPTADPDKIDQPASGPLRQRARRADRAAVVGRNVCAGQAAGI